MFNAMACSARWGLVASNEIEVGVKRRVPLLPWGRVAGRPDMTLEAQSPCLWDRDVCGKGGEWIRPNCALEVMLYWRKT